MANTVISIEIGAARIRMAELMMKKAHQAVKKAEIFDTPDASIEDGFIRDVQAVAGVLEKHIQSAGMTAKEVVFAISSTKIVNREVTVEAAKEKLVKTIVESESSEYFPMDLADYEVTYTIIGRNPEEKQFRLMVYAVPSALLQTYYDLAAEMRKTINAIDVEGNALFQWFRNSNLGEVSLVADINALSMLMTVIDHGELGVQRSVSYGANQFANVLLESNAYDDLETQGDAFRLTREQAFFGTGASDDAIWRENEMTQIRAQRFKKMENEIAAKDPFEEEKDKKKSVLEGLSVNEILERRQEVRNEMAETARQLISNIRRVLDYYATRRPDSQVQKIYLAGLGASLKGLDFMIGAELQIPTETYNVSEGAVFARQASDVEGSGVEFLSCLGAVINPLGLRSRTSAAKGQSKLLGIVAALVGVGAVLAVAGMFVATKLQIAGLEKENEQLQADIAALEPIEELEKIYSESLDAVAFANGLDDLLFTPSEQFNAIIETLEDHLPSRAMVSSFSVSDAVMTLNVSTVTKEEAALLILQLRSIPYMDPEGIRISGISEEKDEATGLTTVTFTLNIDLVKVEEAEDGETEAE